MPIAAKAARAALLAVLILSAMAAAASASTSTWTWSSEAIRFTSNNFIFTPESGHGLNRCVLTLEGSVHTTPFPTTAPVTRIGSITNARASECTWATPIFLIEAGIPWSLTYEGYAGSLPNAISGISLRIDEARFLLASFGEAGTSSCLYIGSIKIPLLTSLVSGSTWRYNVGTAGQTIAESTTRLTEALRGACPTAGITGRIFGEGSPSLTLSNQIATPSPVDFGTVATGSLSRRSVTVSSASSVSITRISVRSGTYFAITDPNRCIGSSIAGEARCSFDVLFDAPAESGRSVEDTVTIETTGGSIDDVVRGST